MQTPIFCDVSPHVSAYAWANASNYRPSIVRLIVDCANNIGSREPPAAVLVIPDRPHLAVIEKAYRLLAHNSSIKTFMLPLSFIWTCAKNAQVQSAVSSPLLYILLIWRCMVEWSRWNSSTILSAVSHPVSLESRTSIFDLPPCVWNNIICPLSISAPFIIVVMMLSKNSTIWRLAIVTYSSPHTDMADESINSVIYSFTSIISINRLILLFFLFFKNMVASCKDQSAQ